MYTPLSVDPVLLNQQIGRHFVEWQGKEGGKGKRTAGGWAERFDKKVRITSCRKNELILQ
jgi:hypothetical protein